jgi:SAM-dependent methyltransferase
MDWHKRFVQQAAWTKDLRAWLFKRLGMASASRVLEVGCGTGAILSGLISRASIHGMDLQPARLVEARLQAPHASLTCGDALWLPFASDVFDIAFCHFLLLWVRDPLQALREMKRVTRPGGSILALAEPDYYNRVDKPNALAILGRWQTQSLLRQGADPGLGMRLSDLFYQAGISLVESGSLHSQVGFFPSLGEQELEWNVLEADLKDLVPRKEVQRLKSLDERAWLRGTRVLYVPTYWAFGISG